VTPSSSPTSTRSTMTENWPSFSLMVTWCTR
jgi:hypothetical protein